MSLLRSFKKNYIIKYYHNIAPSGAFFRASEKQYYGRIFISMIKKLRRSDIIKSQDDFTIKLRVVIMPLRFLRPRKPG